jgi:hypothetical protein
LCGVSGQAHGGHVEQTPLTVIRWSETSLTKPGTVSRSHMCPPKYRSREVMATAQAIQAVQAAWSSWLRRPVETALVIRPPNVPPFSCGRISKPRV